MKKLLLQAVILSTVAILMGLALNSAQLVSFFSVQQLESDHAPLPMWLDDVQPWQRNQQLIVDARPASAFEQGHIPGAHSVPRGDSTALQALVDCCVAQAQLVVYCSGLDCEDSFIVGQQLFDAGFTTIFLYEEGFAGWQQAGLVIERSAP